MAEDITINPKQIAILRAQLQAANERLLGTVRPKLDTRHTGVRQFYISPAAYIDTTLRWLVFPDILSGLMKSVVFAVIIAMVGCYMGLSTTGGTQGVGRATTQSVVVCSVLVLATDFLLTRVFFTFLIK